MRCALTLVLPCALVLGGLTGCGGDGDRSSVGRRSSPTANVGPSCAALRSARHPESDAMDTVAEFVYRSEDGIDDRYAELTDGQKMLFATRYLEDEVNNGGFNQYFYNSHGETLDDAIRGFDAFRAPKQAALARRAKTIFATDKSRIDEVRADRTIKRFSKSYDDEPYHALDEKFFELSSPRGVAAYVRAHARAFCVAN